MSGISVAVSPDAGAPQVGVTVTGLAAGSPSVVTIERTTDGGLTWVGVRGAIAATVVGGGFWRDHVCPLGIPVTYRLTVVSGATVPATLTATITVPSATAWLQDPQDPRTAVPVISARTNAGIALLSPSAGEITRSQPVDLVQVQGARLPVASIGTRQGPSGVLLRLRALAAAQGALVKAVAKLVDQAGTIVIRGLPEEIPLDPVAYVVAPEVRDSPVVGGVLGPRRDWVMTVTQVRAPSQRIAIPWWTYSDVAALWVGKTYADALAARPGDTYLDWLVDPTPGG